MPTLRERWVAARKAWVSGSAASTVPAVGPPSGRPAATHAPTTGKRRRPRSRQWRALRTTRGKQDWRATVTALATIASVLLVAAGQVYTNGANRNQQQPALQSQVADRFTAPIDQNGPKDTPS